MMSSHFCNCIEYGDECEILYLEKMKKSYLRISCESCSVEWNGVSCIEEVKCIYKTFAHPFRKYGMGCKSRDALGSFFSRVSCCLDECTPSTDMVIDDTYISSLEITSLEVHLDIGRRSSDLSARHYLVFSEES